MDMWWMVRDGLIKMVDVRFETIRLSLIPPYRLGGTSYQHHSAARQYLTIGLSSFRQREKETYV